MILINMLRRALPSADKLTFDEKLERANLEFRRDLGMGADPATGMKPLDGTELKKLRKYEAGKWCSRAPRWNGQDFAFAPYGEQGCAWDLPTNVAAFLYTNYNQGIKFACEEEDDEILHIVKPGESLPDGVSPLRKSVDDPLLYSAEALLSRGRNGTRVVSAGYADPDPVPNPADIAVAPSAMPPGLASTGAKAKAATAAVGA